MLFGYLNSIGDVIGIKILDDGTAEAVFPAFCDCASLVTTPKYLKSSELKMLPYFYLGVVTEHIVQTNQNGILMEYNPDCIYDGKLNLLELY